MKMKVAGLTLILALALSNAEAAWMVEQKRKGQTVSVLSVKKVSTTTRKASVVIQSIPWNLMEGPGSSDTFYEKILFHDDYLPDLYHPYIGEDFRKILERPEEAELRTILVQGPNKNRIDLTILGDGYTYDEKDKFFEDAQRTADDLFKAKAFHSYLPLFNIYAVFVPSNESGITDLETKDTAFGLYRSPPGSKRGIMPGNTRAIESALAVAPETDFPVILANDDYYGGLGGRYAITSRSKQSGAMVLRHELGHNFGNVGEEYDGGEVYSGANFSSSAKVGWMHWVSADEGLKVYETKFLAGEYAWKNLSKGAYRLKYKVPSAVSSGDYWIDVSLSSVGWASPEEVMVSIDGSERSYSGIFTADRSFFKLPSEQQSAGTHELQIQEAITDGDNVVAIANVLAQPPELDRRPNQIAAFATFDSSGRKRGYRPTLESCLMRNMRYEYFCAVDQENFWVRFLNQIELIDEVIVQNAIVEVKTPNLPHLQIRWMQQTAGGWEEMEDLRDQRRWAIPEGLSGNFRAVVRLNTPEVRKPTDRFTTTRSFAI